MNATALLVSIPVVLAGVMIATSYQASAQSASKPKQAASHCATLAQSACTSDKACSWKPSETWTRTSDNKIRTTKDRCTFDAKAGRAILASQFANR